MHSIRYTVKDSLSKYNITEKDIFELDWSYYSDWKGNNLILIYCLYIDLDLFKKYFLS